ncbi:MAG: Gfo/Idh/MocA family protein [Acidiferrobacteraceae bacterium]
MLERLLIVGFGSIGGRHARLARQLVPNVQIVALRHRNAPTPPGIDRCVTTVDEALQFRPQAAVIANPATLHLEIALILAKAGVNLLIEKPMCSCADGVSGLIDTAREQGVILLIGYNMRFLPSLQRFRELVQEKRYGLVLSVRAEVGQYLPSWRPDSDYRETVSAKAALGGGVLLELSHEIDYLRWIFGEVDWVSAVLLKQSNLEIDVEDTAYLILGFACGPESVGKPSVASLNLDFIRHDTTRSCTVICETGSLRWNALVGTIDGFDATSNSWQSLFVHKTQRDDSYIAEWRHFLSCISNGDSPKVSGQDGLSVIRVIEAARQSSATRSVVAVRREGEQ